MDAVSLGLLFFLFFVLIIFLVFYTRQVTTMRKITNELNATKARADMEKLRDDAMLDSIGDGVVATDKDGVIIFMNRVAQELLAWDPSALGQKLSELSLLTDEKGQHVPIEKHPLHRCIETKQKIVTKEYHFVSEGHFNLTMYISATPVIVKDEVAGAIEVFRDITTEKAIDQAKTEFVYLASHQLRTPLSTINWYLELLLSGDAGPITSDQKTYLQEAYDSNQHMVSLVNELLDASRLDLGTMAVKSEPVDLVKLTDEALEEIKPLIIKKRLQLQKNFATGIAPYQTDPKLLRMVFQNLLTNSVKYTPEKGVVTVTLKKKLGQILLTVQDTGYGIPLEEQPKIFGKLFRATNVKEKEPGGTGLGLYVVKAAVAQLGGTIRFASPPPKQTTGTAFYITLPLIKKKTESNIFLETIK